MILDCFVAHILKVSKKRSLQMKKISLVFVLLGLVVLSACSNQADGFDTAKKYYSLY